MSKGPGAIEKRIAELFAATRDRGLTVAEIADYAFALAGQPANRAQRLSATRAAHRLLRRMREAEQKRSQLISDAHAEAKAAVGERPTREYPPGYAAYKAARKVYDAAVARYDAALKATEPWRLAEKLDAYGEQFGSWIRCIDMGDERQFWRATADKKGTLHFHPPDVPIRVWAVSVQPAGVIWAEVEEIGRITKDNVTVRYAGETARLDRENLWKHWALGRGVYFVSSRRQDHYGDAAGGVPPWEEVESSEHVAEGLDRQREETEKDAGEVLASGERTMPPLQLNEEEMIVLLSLAEPIEQHRRPQFLQEVAAELEARRQAGEIGEGVVHRVARALQRRFWDPPQFRESEPRHDGQRQAGR